MQLLLVVEELVDRINLVNLTQVLMELIPPGLVKLLHGGGGGVVRPITPHQTGLQVDLVVVARPTGILEVVHMLVVPTPGPGGNPGGASAAGLINGGGGGAGGAGVRWNSPTRFTTIQVKQDMVDWESEFLSQDQHQSITYWLSTGPGSGASATGWVAGGGGGGGGWHLADHLVVGDGGGGQQRW